MSDIKGQKLERVKPHYAETLRTLYRTSDLRPLISLEQGPESVRGLCRAVAPKAFGGAKAGLCEGGFTLLELLSVIGVIAILLVLIGPAFTTIKSGTDVTTAIYGVKGLLENARAYAKANHTYTFVGFAEVDSSVDPSVSPQVTTGDTPYGRVAVAVVASKDGTSQYQYATTDQGSDWTANYANGAHLVSPKSELVTSPVLAILRPVMVAPSITGRVGVSAQRGYAFSAGHPLPIGLPLQRFNALTLQRRNAFTLLELLIVVGIIGLLLVLIAPAFTYIKGGTDVTSAAYTIKGVLDTARTYAKANNTYTWVGFFEEDSPPPPTSPATPGVGRVVMSIVASKDGTNVASGGQIPVASLIQVDKLSKIDNVHLTTFLDLSSPPRGTPPGNTFDYRPLVTVNGVQYTIGDTGDTIPQDTGTLFQYPTGSAYQFRKAVQFSPRGEAQMINSTTTYPVQPAAEIGLTQTHGNSPPTLVLNNGTYVGNMVAIQFTGIGGNVKIYRK